MSGLRFAARICRQRYVLFLAITVARVATVTVHEKPYLQKSEI